MLAAQATDSGGKEIINRTITRITAGAGIALAGLLIPALGASASTQNAPVQHYSWATGFDSGTSAPTWIKTNNGSHLSRYGVSSPYRLTSAGATGFTFGG